MSEASKPHSGVLDALERLYVNVRAEYPFGVRDWEIVKDGLAGLEEQLETCEQEQRRISREAVGSVLKWSERAERAENALRRIADLTSQEVQFAAVGGEAGVMRRIAREVLNPAKSPFPPPPDLTPGAVDHLTKREDGTWESRAGLEAHFEYVDDLGERRVWNPDAQNQESRGNA